MKTIKVGEVHGIHDAAYEQAAGTVSLEEVISIFACKPAVRAVFMVDPRSRYAGAFSRLDLLRWVHIHLFGGKGRREIPIAEFYRLASAKVARDMVSRDMSRFSVREQDSLQDAVDMMLDYEEDIIPVVDTDNRVVGDLTLSEVLLKAFEDARSCPP
jgi:CBS domain-containing protein